MASSRRADEESASLVPFPDRSLAEKPKLVVTHGRGGSGKSTLVRVLVERAQNAGRETVIADADRTNATLPNFFRDVVRPEYTDESSVADWLDAMINQQAEEKLTVILDMGGGDQVFKRFARELDLAAMMQDAGIVPVALHCIGPDLDDLAYLEAVETAFAPPATVLVLNEGLIKDARPREGVFAAVRAHPIFQATLKRGAREIWLPRLACMHEVNSRRLSFAAAAEAGLGLTNRQRVTLWQRQVEQALVPAADWLP